MRFEIENADGVWWLKLEPEGAADEAQLRLLDGDLRSGEFEYLKDDDGTITFRLGYEGDSDIDPDFEEESYDDGFGEALEKIEAVLDGQDVGIGRLQPPRLEDVRSRVLELMKGKP